MKVLLFADGHVGYSIAKYLIENYLLDLQCIVTTEHNDISILSERAKINTIVYKDDLTLIRKTSGSELGLLAWWPLVIKQPLLSICESGFINTHPSLLPNNRGKHPNFWAIVEEGRFGVSLHYVEPEIDAGDLIAQREIIYDWLDTGQSLYEEAEKAMIDLFVEQYPNIRNNKSLRRPQDLSAGSFHFAKEIDPQSHIFLEKTYTGREILNLLRARTFAGRPGCFFNDNGETYEINIAIEKKK
ncbi:formyltransferase family protein [Gammaproteobacteria bacterium]|nr:formyltransferase family protein [Gammaproteobacteria bacterium]